MFGYKAILSSLKIMGAAGATAAGSLGISSMSGKSKEESNRMLASAKALNPNCDVYWQIEQVGFAESTFLQSRLMIVRKKDASSSSTSSLEQSNMASMCP